MSVRYILENFERHMISKRDLTLLDYKFITKNQVTSTTSGFNHKATPHKATIVTK